MPIELTGQSLTLDEIERIAADGESVTLGAKAQERVRASRQVVEDVLRRDDVVYGINTGFGNFRNVVIPENDLERLQLNLIRSHSAGVGEPFSEQDVRARRAGEVGPDEARTQLGEPQAQNGGECREGRECRELQPGAASEPAHGRRSRSPSRESEDRSGIGPSQCSGQRPRITTRRP